jgi:hypothetical protein
VHAEVLHANGSPGWTHIAEVLDDDESEDFTDFDDDEDTPGATEEQVAACEAMELTQHERGRLANLHQCKIWGPARSSDASPFGGAGGAGTSSRQ